MDPHHLGKLDHISINMESQIQIRNRVKNWILIRIRMTVSRRQLWRLTTEPSRLYRPMLPISYLHHEDPDQIVHEKADRIRIKVISRICIGVK
jgi:hypothetical protein